MTPEQLAQSGTEHAHQSAVFAWANFNKVQYPELEHMFAIPNGGSRGDNAKSRAIRGATMKAEGVKSGVPDIMLPVIRRGYCGLFIEMKKIGGTLDKNQKDDWHPFLLKQGYCVTTCWGWTQATEALQWYLGKD
jgi:hypothetical protein